MKLQNFGRDCSWSTLSKTGPGKRRYICGQLRPHFSCCKLNYWLQSLLTNSEIHQISFWGGNPTDIAGLPATVAVVTLGVLTVVLLTTDAVGLLFKGTEVRLTAPSFQLL